MGRYLSAAKAAEDSDVTLPASPGSGSGRGDVDGVDALAGESVLLEELIARAPHAIAFVDGPSHVLRRVSDDFCRILDTEPGDLLGRPCADVFTDPGDDGLLALLERVRASGAAEAEYEILHGGANGESSAWNCTAWPLGEHSAGNQGLVVELRERPREAAQVQHLREMAEQIRQINERLLRAAIQEQEWAEKAEAATRAQSDFLSMMSHELRTPLTGIVGYAEVLLGQMVGPINDKQRDGLQRINACAAQLIELIDAVLSFAQAEAKSVQVRPRLVDLVDVIREALTIIEPMAARKHLRLRVEIPEGSLPLETDARWVRQILLNLMGNAVKFTPEGEVGLEVREETDELVVAVRDTGIGISADDLERVFEPFVQSEAVMTRRFGGSGLGLPISRSLASVLGGSLTAESSPGEGSVFVLHLPRAARNPPAA
jgi:signal transduction histidine kinase